MEEKRGVLEKLKKNSISATDIASQYWCELQMELNYIHGREFNAAMKGGAKIHKELQAEIETTISVEPLGYPDFLYKEAYENYLALKSLNEKGIGREIKIYGSIGGYKFSGKIDELRKKDGKVTIVETKTKALNAKLGGKNEGIKEISEATMRTHKTQIMLYRRLLGDLCSKNYTYQNFYNSYGIKKMVLNEKFVAQLDLLGIEKKMQSFDTIYNLMYEQLYKLPQISDTLEISYVDRYSGNQFAAVNIDYNKDEFDKILVDAMGYWGGERAARPVVKEEAWKCNFCKFYGNQCKIWWSG
ncbi:MAG: PD-(D/E)XK nuclease family protein [Candidatus Micrarchaeales archaeon]